MSNKTAWIGDNASQQIQEQSAKYGGGAEMSGYAALTVSTSTPGKVSIPSEWVLTCLKDVCELNNHPLKAGGLELRTESPDTRRLNDAS